MWQALMISPWTEDGTISNAAGKKILPDVLAGLYLIVYRCSPRCLIHHIVYQCSQPGPSNGR
jgi:hypothetical protein